MTLEELQELSQQTFLLALQSQVKQQLSERIETPPSDLSPSPGVSQLLNLLREVLSVRNVAEGRQQDLTKVKANGGLLPSDTRYEVHIDIRKNEARRSFMSCTVFTQM